jgi:hypothetical protein
MFNKVNSDISDKVYMSFNLYAIYDKAANDLSPLYQCRTKEVAIRQFHNAIAQTGFAEEYELWKIGTYEVQSEDITSERIKTRVNSSFEVIALGSDLTIDDINLDTVDVQEAINE